MNHWLWGYYEILPQISSPWCDLRWKIIWVRLERRRSTCGSNFNSTPKDLSVYAPDAAAKHLLHRDSNVFPHADTIATFQFQLHLKPPISAAVAVIEIWNPAYIQAITANTRPQLLCVCREKWAGEETTGINYSRNTFLFIYYSIMLNWPLTPSSSSLQTIWRKWQPCWIRRKSNRIPGARWYESSNLTESYESPLWVNPFCCFRFMQT